ncbi:hypothetical protein L228DRAFT_235085 [Xylona heveae TC161]|uniref:Uncharacterized protein n=1 Tax=Xylona heveae (strain CBS 132557 / TC161) TaxID=1328760 RepID=A0A165JA37_XYLHT|nr:hypothetical protein L228DRAFT_235085 [Xylona heveae TC161]KZF25958.1 hypothetical protein L228DRAFT_235085 [Xylona heveae TC161]
MRFFTVIATLSLTVAVSALGNSTSTGQSPSGTTASQQACLNKCTPTDLNCQAACVGVPSPNNSQANKNTQCAQNCDQGNGSPEDTKKYGECLSSCASSYYWQDSSATPTHRVSKVTETVEPTEASPKHSTSSSHAVATSSSAAVFATSTATGAAAHHVVVVPIAGFAGAVVAAIAL